MLRTHPPADAVPEHSSGARLKTGHQFQDTNKQTLGILIAPHARRNLRQHANGRHVRRKLKQVVAKQCFGDWYTVLDERLCRLQQSWIASGGLDLLGVGCLSCRLIAAGAQVICQCRQASVR